MQCKWRIENLNDLFFALFHPIDDQPAIIQGNKRLVREDYFRMFFPELLCTKYLNKSKANLTWFFNDDRKNKAIKHTLIDLMQKDFHHVINEMHHLCKKVLWPNSQYPSFDKSKLLEVLSSIQIRSSLNSKLHILNTSSGNSDSKNCRMWHYFDADPSAALARAILTLAISSDADEDLIKWIWSERSYEESKALISHETSIDGQIRHGKLLYLNGQYERAYKTFARAAKQLNRPAKTLEESVLYCRLASMLFAGEGHYQDPESALKYLEMGCTDANPESFYLLSRHTDGECSKLALEKAANMGYPSAIREIGNRCFNTYRDSGCQDDLNKAQYWFQKGLSLHAEIGAHCAYMLGRIFELRDDTNSAMSYFKLAQEKGSQDASDRLLRFDWISIDNEATLSPPVSDSVDTPLRYCIMNEPTGNNNIFVRTLRGTWEVNISSVYADSLRNEDYNVRIRLNQHSNVSQIVAELGEKLFSADQDDSYPEVVIALLSDDLQDNLHQCLDVIKTLQRLPAASGKRKWDLVDAVSIYVKAEHEYASFLLDAAYLNLKSIYFKIRLCDPAEDSANVLLSSAPIFSPFLQNEDVESVHMVVLGTSETAMSILRKAISLPLSEENRVSITVFGKHIDLMGQRFLTYCPGIEQASPLIPRIVPKFCECTLNSCGISTLLRQFKASRGDENLKNSDAELLTRGNYIVVATDDDTLNIQLAIYLRKELLKLDSNYANFPFISAYVSNPITSLLVQNISATSNTNWLSNFNQYNIFCFGPSSLYTYTGFKKDVTELQAQEIHLMYANSPTDKTERHLALASYYQRQYNRESSRAMAQHLIYRLYAAGIVLPNWRLYSIPSEISMLAEQYKAWLSSDENLLKASHMEHNRWNCFMLSAGWEQASPKQVSNYIQRGNPGHQLHLAKLHPFICDVKSLESGELVQEIEKIVQTYYPEKKVRNPLDADRESVLCTPDFLKIY